MAKEAEEKVKEVSRLKKEVGKKKTQSISGVTFFCFFSLLKVLTSMRSGSPI